MSVANTNVFALLDDEGTEDAGQLAAKLPVALKPSSEAAPPASRLERGGAGGGDRGRARLGMPLHDVTTAGFDVDVAPSTGRGHEGRGGGMGTGRGRGRGRDGPPRKREFDRHDASGRGHETEKRHGAGRGNWGAEGEEVKGLEEKLTLVDAEGTAANSDTAEDEPTAPAPAPVVEEEEKQLSLGEYEALMAEKRAGLNAQRSAAFKVDTMQFQGMKAFEKVQDDAGLGLSKHAKVIGGSKAGRDKERKEKEVVDVGFRVATADEVRPQRSSSGRGGRGEGRGGGRGARGFGGIRDDRGGAGRGEGRGEHSSSGHGEGRRPHPRGGPAAAIKINDTSAFPTLG